MNNQENRIHDVIHTNKKLILVFEYVDTDLKKFMNQFDKGMDIKVVKVSYLIQNSNINLLFFRVFSINLLEVLLIAIKWRSSIEILSLKIFLWVK